MSNKTIDECVRANLETYFRDLHGTEPGGMYDMLIRAVEKPLLDVVMETDTAGLDLVKHAHGADEVGLTGAGIAWLGFGGAGGP